MWRVDRNLWACLALGLTACSFVADFPSRPENDDKLDGGRDARVRDTGTRDTGRDVGPNSRDDDDMLTGCQVGNNMGCGETQLCCDQEDGAGAVCIDTLGSRACTACGAACTDPKAPHCGARVCECEQGTGQACSEGQLCVGEGEAARCVECMADVDCKGKPDAREQCVANKCVQCDRGPALDDSSDDQGCQPETPVCSATNQCTGCTVSPTNCPGGMVCTPGQGCFGCRTGVPISQNGCGGTSPVCGTKVVNGTTVQQCRKCVDDTECSGGYCLNATGECVTGCDPDELPIANHCPQVTPICKAGALGFSCKACSVPADCAGLAATPLCQTEGTLSGQCVACRTNTDCSQTGASPVCGIAGTCRPRIPSDCTGTKPKFDPTTNTCVECLQASGAADCAINANGPVCTSKLTCGQCETSAQCNTPAAPVCNPMTNKCSAGCTNDTQCAGLPATPHCDTSAGPGVCVACANDTQCLTAGAPLCSPITKTCMPCTTIAPPAMASARCAAKNPGNANARSCLTSGMRAGQCGGCNPAPAVGECVMPTPFCSVATNTCIPCDEATEAGCPLGATSQYQCITMQASTGPACYPCDPSKPTASGCVPGYTCTAGFQCVLSVPDAGI